MTPLDETPEGSRLFAELRALRERTGLSLVGLAARTAYSKSSWQRYLNGRKLPPRDAVEQLCRLAGPVPWWRRTAVLTTGVGVLCGALTVGVVLLWPHQQAPAGPPRAGCTDSACDGRDPLGAETGCGANSPVTLGSYRPRDGRVWLDLRYAKACHAGWARVYGQRPGDRIAVSVPGKSPQSLYIRDDADAHDRRPTPMLGTRDPQALRVCFTPVETGEQQCHRAKH